MTTSQLIAHFHSNRDFCRDVRLSLNNGEETRYRMGHADPVEFTPHVLDLGGIWKLSYCDNSEEYIRDKELLKWYPDALGDVWTLE